MTRALALAVMLLVPAARLLVAQDLEAMEKRPGLFDVYWDEEGGRVLLAVERFGEEFLYADSLARGLGSNPVGLDRGRLGRSRVVRFERVGPKVLLVERNLRYRADTPDPAMRRAVEESFAESVIWGGVVGEALPDGGRLVDITGLLLSDVHRIAAVLKTTKQGKFKLDAARSAVVPEALRAFPDNVELAARLTFVCDEPGPEVRATAASPESVTLRVHHSFVRLPGPGFVRRRHDPRAASFAIRYADHAAPIDGELQRRFIVRHRLRPANPGAPRSAAVKPLVYYVDRAIPEPVRSAVLEGAGWWAKAFEAAGYEDAFRVELLPEDADPLDIRYHVVQWVHRATRGWSYGGSIVDPRSGEIIKAHVRLGSLRIRQDRLLIEGLRPVYGGGCAAAGPAAEALAALDPQMTPIDVALARIRQLAAHEVGHTLGFSHNFAASTFGRASVMDYPAPLVKRRDDGTLDLSDAYAVGIGAWDEIAVRYAYTCFAEGSDERAGLDAILSEAAAAGMVFLSDADARPAGAAHPRASLWDNGSDPVAELERVLAVRKAAMSRFSEASLPEGRPLADLELTFVPLFLHHRYQVTAAAKLLGGTDYRHALRGDGGGPAMTAVAPERERAALDLLLHTLDPGFLTVPAAVLDLLPPSTGGGAGRERFPSRRGAVFDPLAAAEVAAEHTLDALLQPERAARMEYLAARDPLRLGFGEVAGRLVSAVAGGPPPGEPPMSRAIRTALRHAVVRRLMSLADGDDIDPGVRRHAYRALLHIGDAEASASGDGWLRIELRRFLERSWERGRGGAPAPPPGSPIGGGIDRR